MHEKSAGAQLAKTFEVRAFPTFVLTDAGGRTVDRWLGYDRAPDFIRSLRQAASDLTTFDKTRRRFATAPTAADAAKLARIHAACAHYAAGVMYYRAAQRLAVDPAADYSYPIFDCLMTATGDSTVAAGDLEAAADSVLAAKNRSPGHVVGVAQGMRSYAQDHKQPALMIPYVKAAIEASEDDPDPEVREARRSLLVEHALYVLGDKERALAARRDLLPEGWAEDAGELNSFAWKNEHYQRQLARFQARLGETK